MIMTDNRATFCHAVCNGIRKINTADKCFAVVAGGVTVGEKAVVSPKAMIREDVKGGEQA